MTYPDGPYWPPTQQQPAPAPGRAKPPRPRWLIPVLAASAAVVIIAVAVAAWSLQRPTAPSDTQAATTTRTRTVPTINLTPEQQCKFALGEDFLEDGVIDHAVQPCVEVGNDARDVATWVLLVASVGQFCQTVRSNPEGFANIDPSTKLQVDAEFAEFGMTCY